MPGSTLGVASEATGFYGKVPILGDFVTRHLPRPFVDRWDDWMQNSIVFSKEQLGEDWLPLYLTAPIWRFALSQGVCGELAMCGLMMPSVDQSGRYFPLCLAGPLGLGMVPTQAVVAGRSWYDSAEQILLSALEENIEFAQFEEQVLELGAPAFVAATAADIVPNDTAWAGSVAGFRLHLDNDRNIPALFGELAHLSFAARYSAYSLWWTAGSKDMPGSFVVANAMPEPSGFSAFLDGSWQDWGWQADTPADSSSRHI